MRLARTAIELLLASHPIVCCRCPANRRCDLQKIAGHLGVKLKGKRFHNLMRDLPIDDSSDIFTFEPSKCVLCGRCVRVCRERAGVGAIAFSKRGFERIVTTFGKEPIAKSTCTGCGECVTVCPAGALVLR